VGRRASAGGYGVSPVVNVSAATVARRACRRLIGVQVRPAVVLAVGPTADQSCNEPVRCYLR
jgi:hypothetical protein